MVNLFFQRSLSIIWTINLGDFLDKGLSDSCYGNRIYTNQYRPKQLFEKYNRKYKLWWHSALEETKVLLSKKKNATVFNFDIKSYYHSAEIDFSEIEIVLEKQLDDFSNRRVFDLLLSVHQKYKVIIHEVYPTVVTDEVERYPLPIGLLSSFVLGNFYLKELDDDIEGTNPIYYGRYVDDIILVYAGMKKLKKKENIKSFVSKKLNKILQIVEKDDSDEIWFANNKYKNLEVQKEKLNLYEFSYKNTPSILSVMIEDQKKKSSEFRYLSDILDDNFDDFEGVVFEGNFDFEEGNKAKFKDVNENKFKIASFLAKLTKRVIDHGIDYKQEEVEKVFKFFTGKYLFKHYYFWEKLLTLYWVSGNVIYFDKTVESIEQSISKLEIKSQWDLIENQLKESLSDYLEVAIDLSKALNESEHYNKTDKKKSRTVPRDHYSIFPFLPYTKAFLENSINLLDHNSLNDFKDAPDLIKVDPTVVPIGKPFYWCYLATYFYYLFAEKFNKKNQKKILNKAFDLYKSINRCEIKKDEIFKIAKIQQNNTESKSLFEISGRSKEIAEIKSNCRTAIVNQLIPKENFISSLKLSPLKSAKRESEIRFELDQISKIPTLDIVVKPELAIPLFSLYNYVRHSSKFQYSLNSGIEYAVSKKNANNFIICTIPIKIADSFRDCIPIIRLKNEYSYEERKIIKNESLKIPKKEKQEFFLFRSNGIYFTNYYCFELTSIENRALFKSMVDLIVAPVWNKDNFYFKAISETLVRDIHCYYAQSNTSEFADSRMIRPTKSIHLVKSLVKGGTVPEPRFNFSFLIDDIDLMSFRKFQLMKYKETQEVEFKKGNIYKPLPPDFNKNNVKKRIQNVSINSEELNSDTFNIDELPF